MIRAVFSQKVADHSAMIGEPSKFACHNLTDLETPAAPITSPSPSAVIGVICGLMVRFYVLGLFSVFSLSLCLRFCLRPSRTKGRSSHAIRFSHSAHPSSFLLCGSGSRPGTTAARVVPADRAYRPNRKRGT